MTKKEHRERHIMLHEALDELFADYITHHPNGSPFLKTTIQDLLEWSHRQTENPDEDRQHTTARTRKLEIIQEAIEGKIIGRC